MQLHTLYLKTTFEKSNVQRLILRFREKITNCSSAPNSHQLCSSLHVVKNEKIQMAKSSQKKEWLHLVKRFTAKNKQKKTFPSSR